MSSCAHCGAPVSRDGRRGPLPKYCCDVCRNRAKWDRQKAANPCPGCGEPMARSSSSSAADQLCRKCRFGGREHGTEAMYSKGQCRCEACKKAKTARVRKWREARRAAGNPVVSKRRMMPATCESCKVSFMARIDVSGRFCSMGCAGNAPGVGVYRGRPNIPAKLRSAICERDDNTCQLCSSPVRHDVDVNHPRYPNLDHIVPFSKGGSDGSENLRLTCRQCNMMRGASESWVPELAGVCDESSREVA